LVRASTRASVYEAQRKRDGGRVLAKVFDLVAEGAEARVEHEFRLLQQLDVEGVVRPLGLERAGRQVVLLLEYVPGRNLQQQAAGKPIPLARLLPQAREMVAILARIHDRRIIHRDIKPSNVLVDERSGKIVFADFGISVLLEDEQQRLHDPEILQGTLPYVSPEQTGRTRRDVDFRSDLYSLGVTFYELATGRRPFEHRDPLELLHAHLAQRPAPPRELLETIPERFSAMVMKLLEKAPEHRYQSAHGLAADLDRLAEALAAGETEPDFPLGEHDRPSSLQLPHQLYGRARERELLDRELRAVLERGDRRLVLLSGPPGSGKTALMRGFDAPLRVHGGYLGVGKFEQAHGDALEQPYRGFAEALGGVVRQILAESDEQLASWRTRLRGALGSIAGVVGALIPELSLIVGETRPVPQLEMAEARNRLHLALSRFVAAIADAGPLVLVLDDLQWSDAGSLELLGKLMLDAGGPVLFVGASRNAELDALTTMANSLEAAGVSVLRMAIDALHEDAVEQLLADVLGRDREQVRPLAALLARKTNNNPLFVRQYLLQLAELGLLRPGERGFEWELEAVASATIPDDLLGVMRAKLGRLAARERTVVEVAACIGARFDGTLLDAVIQDLDSEAIVAALYELEHAGLIAWNGAQYQFVHDGVQEAARAGLELDARASIHRAIGRELLARHPADDRGEAVFAIADQLNQGFVAVPEHERELFGQLNLEAGLRALDSAAWRSSRRYLELASAAFGSERHDRAAFEVRFGLASAQAMAGEVELADVALGGLLDWELALVDYARVVARRIRIRQLHGFMREGFVYGRMGLERCGLHIPTTPSPAQMLSATRAAKRLVASATLEQLLALPDATDERAIAAMQILTAMQFSAFAIDKRLYVYLTVLHARLVMDEGWVASAVEGLAQFARVAVLLGHVEDAVRLSDHLTVLCSRREIPVGARVAAQTAAYVFVGPHGRPHRSFMPLIEPAFQAALEAGDRLSAGYVGALGLWLHVEAGTHLREVVELEAALRRDLADYGSREVLTIANTVRCFVASLSAERDEDSPGFLVVDSLGRAQVSSVARHAILVAEIWGRMLFGEHERARELMDSIAHDYEKVLFGSWVVPRATLCDAILVGEQARRAPARERGKLLRRLQRRLATARAWAQGCEENYAATVDVIVGELAWIDGDVRTALDAFERARSSAADAGRTYVEVFACLRIAALGQECNWATTREGALRAAHAALSRWGAWAVVRRFELEHPELGIGRVERGSARSTLANTLSSGTISSGRSVSSLDLESVLRTVQTISEDLRLEEVITRVLGSAIENAGADRGALLLERGGTMLVVAEARDARTAAPLDEPVALRDAGQRVPSSVIHYVLRTGEPIVVDDVAEDIRFANDEYLAGSDARSLLCVPIVKQNQRVGALVLENRLITHAFTEHRLATLQLLLGQAAGALDNARLYAQLQRSEAQWRSLVDGVPDIIALLDERGRIEFINRSLDPSAFEAWGRAFAEVVERGEPRELEICVSPPGEARRWFMTRLAPIAIAGQGAHEVDRYLAIATDVTAHKHLEAQLRQQQRLESVGTLASGVAHEINNPVQGILNYAELISERAEQPEIVRDFAGEIARESDRVAAIVRNLLAFSRQDAEQRFERSNVSGLIENTLSLIRAVLRKDQIGVELDIPADLPPIHCRAQQVQQVIMNLVTNARDALNERYEQYDASKLITIRARVQLRADAQWVRISVEDRAGGIPEHLRARIFDPFFTTKGRDRGTGLGLAVSHGIAVDHGGQLSVESEFGRGSVFHLDLPTKLE
jgi:predicted ATPase/signal transduction histidine kinase/tRNA A-37 threonylcarbamoyl transferase component Bud32